jgi:hypothetical protein
MAQTSIETAPRAYRCRYGTPSSPTIFDSTRDRQLPGVNADMSTPVREERVELKRRGHSGVDALAVAAINIGGEDAVDACAGVAARPSEAMKWRPSAASQLHGGASIRGGRRDGCRRTGSVGDRCQVPRWRFGGSAQCERDPAG